LFTNPSSNKRIDAKFGRSGKFLLVLDTVVVIGYGSQGFVTIFLCLTTLGVVQLLGANNDWLPNSCWSSPAQRFLVPRSTGLMPIFYFWRLWEPPVSLSVQQPAQVRSGKLLLVLASTVNFDFRFCLGPWPIFIISKGLKRFEMGPPPLQREEGYVCYRSLFLWRGWVIWARAYFSKWPFSEKTVHIDRFWLGILLLCNPADR
jgi:hypothetical protein